MTDERIKAAVRRAVQDAIPGSGPSATTWAAAEMTVIKAADIAMAKAEKEEVE